MHGDCSFAVYVLLTSTVACVLAIFPSCLVSRTKNHVFLVLMTSTPQSLKNQEGCLSFRSRIVTHQRTPPFSHSQRKAHTMLAGDTPILFASDRSDQHLSPSLCH